MKATLEFDLSDPDDRHAHLRCIKALDMAIVLFELRSNTKKKIERRVDKGENPIEAFYEEFGQLLEDQGLFIDDLIY